VTYSFITRELFEERINGTYDEENIDPNEKSLCWWEVGLIGVTLKDSPDGMRNSLLAD